ncbi:unnamed protein product [Polarella glacialis]|uniref:Endonuclease/exonuclease/phosphatase domain-containing protein n=1 Tax=Polarella glacialis TaxID=89957 RepID=A0A813LCU6_POLGL|nr:unnamed protein product [Polarella glacialis]
MEKHSSLQGTGPFYVQFSFVVALAGACCSAQMASNATQRRTSTEGGRHVTLMQFNVRTGFADWGLETMWRHPLVPFNRTRRAAVAACVHEHLPDFVATQEGLSWQLRHMASDLDHGYAFVGGFRGGPTWNTDESSAIFYRKSSWDLEVSGDFMLSQTPEVPYSSYPGASYPMITSWAVLASRPSDGIKEPSRVLIVSTHLDPYVPEVRAASAEQLRQTVAELRQTHSCQQAFLLGDFNSDFEESPWQLLKQAGWVDSWEEKNGAYPAGSFTYHAFQGPSYKPEGPQVSDPNHTIDFIWLWGGGPGTAPSVVSSKVERQRYTSSGPCASGVLPSDHYALVTEVLLPL